MPATRAAHRRLVLLTTAACAAGVLAATLPAASAYAWGNGGDRPGPDHTVRNGYGTHDWVVDQAYRIAGGRAGVGAWFDPATARQWSGYPDVYRKATEHIFNESGHGRGAAQQAAAAYVRTVRAYGAGDYTTASKEFGILSHFIADVSMPYHTKRDPRGGHDEARAYEVYTTGLTDAADSARDLCPAPARLPQVHDVRQVVSDIAARSRTHYRALVRVLQQHGPAAARPITAQLLPLTCNNLAALLLSVPTASAMPAPVARVRVKLVRTKVRVGQTPKVDVSVFGPGGRRIDGAEFRVDWPGTRHDHRMYTMPDADVRTHGASARTTRRASVRVTVLDPGGAGALASGTARTSVGAAVTVTRTYRVMTRAQLQKARAKARAAHKHWRP